MAGRGSLKQQGCMRMGAYPRCSPETKYQKLVKIGQGTFGEVHKARNKATNELVAMKTLLLENEKEGFPITALREIKILQRVEHENVVRLIEVCSKATVPYSRGRGGFVLIFEFCEHDLAGLLSKKELKFTLGEIKSVMKQLLLGLYHLHYLNILHRDMKAANILMTKDGVLKIADFGLARTISDVGLQKRYTNRVVTLWYRPPELLLGERFYTGAIDMWGAGCIFAEFWTRRPILQGKTEQEQLQLISHLCGSITPTVWPGVENLQIFKAIELPQNSKRKMLTIILDSLLIKIRRTDMEMNGTDLVPVEIYSYNFLMANSAEQKSSASLLRNRLENYVQDPYALDLLDKLLVLDPAQRCDSDTALSHNFFFMKPDICDLKPMLSRIPNSQFEFLTTRHQAQAADAAPPPARAHSQNQHREHIF